MRIGPDTLDGARQIPLISMLSPSLHTYMQHARTAVRERLGGDGREAEAAIELLGMNTRVKEDRIQTKLMGLADRFLKQR